MKHIMDAKTRIFASLFLVPRSNKNTSVHGKRDARGRAIAIQRAREGYPIARKQLPLQRTRCFHMDAKAPTFAITTKARVHSAKNNVQAQRANGRPTSAFTMAKSSPPRPPRWIHFYAMKGVLGRAMEYVKMGGRAVQMRCVHLEATVRIAGCVFKTLHQSNAFPWALLCYTYSFFPHGNNVQSCWGLGPPWLWQKGPCACTSCG